MTIKNVVTPKTNKQIDVALIKEQQKILDKFLESLKKFLNFTLEFFLLILCFL